MKDVVASADINLRALALNSGNTWSFNLMTDNGDYVMGLKLLIRFSKYKPGDQYDLFKDVIRKSRSSSREGERKSIAKPEVRKRQTNQPILQKKQFAAEDTDSRGSSSRKPPLAKQATPRKAKTAKNLFAADE